MKNIGIGNLNHVIRVDPSLRNNLYMKLTDSVEVKVVSLDYIHALNQ